MNENNHIKNELAELNSFLANSGREQVYTLPAGYFDTLAETILKRIRAGKMENAADEIANLSPLLKSLKGVNPYSVPAGYFENLQVKPRARVISITHTRWFRMAAAAMITGIFVMSGFYIFNGRSIDKAPMAKFARDVKKMNNTQKDNLIEFIDAGLTGKEQAHNNNAEIKTNEIRALLHDIPADELKDFQEQTEDINDVLMTN